MAYTIAIDARKIHDFGIGTYVRNLVRHLGEIDSENRYVLLTHKLGQDVLSELPENFHLAVESSPVYSIREMVTLSWKLFRLDLDLYHSTHYVLPAVVPTRVVVSIHDIIHLLYPEFLPNRLALLYAQRMIRRALHRGDRIITGSQNTKADLMEYFDIDGSRIQVVYNGVDDVFRQPVPAAERRERLDRLGLSGPYLLFVGNASKAHKNLDIVVQAYARALTLHPFEASLVCVGDRDNASFKILQRAEQLGIADRLRILGHVEDQDLPSIYQGATLFVFPTLYEGFGLPVVEAMASGVPVITSNTSALNEIADGYSHLVDPLDIQGIAEAIAHCMRDEEHREALAKLGRRRAEDFHWKGTASKTLEIYLAAIRGGSRLEKAVL